MPIVDLVGLSENSQAEAVHNWACREAYEAFNLERGPLFRIRLLTLRTDECVVLFTLHHIISDEWSAGILLRDLASLYYGLVSDRLAVLPELPIQYGDFAYWERSHMSGEMLENEIRYWKNKLMGVPQVLAIGTDRPRPTVQTLNGRTQRFMLDAGLGGGAEAS